MSNTNTSNGMHCNSDRAIHSGSEITALQTWGDPTRISDSARLGSRDGAAQGHRNSRGTANHFGLMHPPTLVSLATGAILSESQEEFRSGNDGLAYISDSEISSNISTTPLFEYQDQTNRRRDSPASNTGHSATGHHASLRDTGSWRPRAALLLNVLNEVTFIIDSDDDTALIHGDPPVHKVGDPQ